jgi:hypothetical protein
MTPIIKYRKFTNNDRTILGCGLFSSIKAWDLELSAADVKEVFDSPD